MKFNEDTRVKIPATIQFLRLGYSYQSLKTANIHPETRIIIDRFKKAIEKINCQTFSTDDINKILVEIDNTIKNNDLGKAFYEWLIRPNGRIKLIDFDNVENNDFAVVNELSFGPSNINKRKGSFRPDITVFINGIPVAFKEVKKPNNEGGIQAEFNRMVNERLKNPDFKKFFNMFQIVTFSNNMEYEEDDGYMFEDVKAGSFYTTPNGINTSFSFFREEKPKTSGFNEVSNEKIKFVIEDNHYDPNELETEEFKTNLDINTPCNRFISSIYEKNRLLYFIRYGIMYVDGIVPEKHIMRYQQFFASRAIRDWLDSGKKSGIIWHTQGSGKTNLAAICTRLLRDYYAKKNISARFYYVSDRLDLVTQTSNAMAKRGINVINVSSRKDFEKELNKPISSHAAVNTDGEIVVVNIQKFDDEMPAVKNEYNANVQRIFFIDEAHRSYKSDGEYFKNLMLVDDNAIYLALTGTPLLSKKERSNLKFGDYIHKYFYGESIADGYTLRIKKEHIDTVARTEIKKNLEFDDVDPKKSDIYESEKYINCVCKYIEKDFEYFRLVNSDSSIGGMIVCASNPQAIKIKAWFDSNSRMSTGLVIDSVSPSDNKKTQISFKEKTKPDILIVHQMLTTGYDVNRLKKMYLLRNAKEHNLLQTIARVNRPYKNPEGKIYKYGYIVDFVDIAEEYDRTIEMYLKEIEEGFENTDETIALAGIIVGPEEINERYKDYVLQLNSLVDTSNLERFSRALTFKEPETLFAIRKLLKEIKDCYREFKLSKAKEYWSQIDIEKNQNLIKAVQSRIDFIKLKSKPTDLLSIISNDEVVEIIYEFLKTKIDILDVSKLSEEMNDVEKSEEYKELTGLIGEIQEEIKKNKDHEQLSMIKLDEILRRLFSSLDINNIANINDELKKLLDEAKKINEENAKIAKRYNGSLPFVKTYTTTIESHPDIDREIIAKIIDVVFEATKEIKSANTLILQNREDFVSNINNKTTVPLINSGLFDAADNLDDWYDDLLYDTYDNLKNY